MQFTNDDLDRTLETVKSAVGRMAATLFELDAERERRAVEAGRLTGGSAQAWDQTGGDLLTMWASYQALSEKISAVEAERGARPFSRATADRITEELLGPSIQADLSALSSALERTAETMTSLWTMRDLAGPRLDEIEGRLASASAEARRAGLRTPNEVASVLARVQQLRVQVTGDPLAVAPEQIAELSLTADRIGREVDESVARSDAAFTELGRLTAAIDAVCQTVEGARRDAAEAREKVMAFDPPRDLDALSARAEGLRTEAADAGRMAATDRAGAARVVARLAAELDRIDAEAIAAAADAAAPLARRGELRGRLDAYRAKAVATGRAEDLALDELYQSAVSVLYQAPCDLDAAGRSVAAYQNYLLRTRREDRQA